MDFGILKALNTVKSNPYVQYVGLGLAALVTQKEQHDPSTGEPLRKTKLQLVRISAAVCGIELCYAAETAFVSPILLKLGVPTSLMTLTWCLSPMLGFFLVPVMGSLSDRCKLRFGRRRPFIILMSIGIVLGLALVPNGETLGILLGDHGNETVNAVGSHGDTVINLNQSEVSINSTTGVFPFSVKSEHFRGILFTILGVAMLDFNCDACQSPCRAYLLDVSVPGDHSTGLTTFTVMAGAGGSIGYIMGGLDWNSTNFGEALGGHIRVVFSIVLIAFFICTISTLTSFREIPLSELSITGQDLQVSKTKVGSSKYQKFTNEDSPIDERDPTEDMALDRDVKASQYGSFSGQIGNTNYAETTKECNPLDNSTFLSGRVSSSQKFKSTEIGTCRHDVDTRKGMLERGFIIPSTLDENYQGLKLQNGKLANSNPQKSKEIKTDFLQSEGQRQQLSNKHSTLPARINTRFSDSLQNGTPKWTQIESSSRGVVASGDSKEVDDEINPYSKHSSSIDVTSMKEIMNTERQVQVSTDVTLSTYLRSIVRMPRSMWVLCLCNLLCWMSLVCYSLYFTDFVGQSVYGGNPHAPVGSDLHNRYDSGVRLGSLGMSLYSLACACYSLTIERLVKRFGAKKVYMLGQLVFTVGMAGMALSRSKVAVILLSPSAGIMYATLFTMPYLLVAHYHTRGLFCQADKSSGEVTQIRGLGTDVAIISSMVFLAQFLLSLVIGSLVVAMGSPVIVIMASCVLSSLGSITASQITYLDL